MTNLGYGHKPACCAQFSSTGVHVRSVAQDCTVLYLDQEHIPSAKVTEQAKRDAADVRIMSCPLG